MNKEFLEAVEHFVWQVETDNLGAFSIENMKTRIKRIKKSECE